MAVADHLHSAAIHLLRRLRREDSSAGLGTPALSALSVLVSGGPRTVGELAAAEQVRPATMSRLVSQLEADGWVAREADPQDGRRSRICATREGVRVLHAGRDRRIRAFAEQLRGLPADELTALERAAEVLGRVLREAG